MIDESKKSYTQEYVTSCVTHSRYDLWSSPTMQRCTVFGERPPPRVTDSHGKMTILYPKSQHSICGSNLFCLNSKQNLLFWKRKWWIKVCVVFFLLMAKEWNGCHNISPPWKRNIWEEKKTVDFAIAKGKKKEISFLVAFCFRMRTKWESSKQKLACF